MILTRSGDQLYGWERARPGMEGPVKVEFTRGIAPAPAGAASTTRPGGDSHRAAWLAPVLLTRSCEGIR